MSDEVIVTITEVAEEAIIQLTEVSENVVVTIQEALNGEIGLTGPPGASGGSTSAWEYNAKTNATSGYPGNGYLLWNNATQTSATSIIVSHLTDDDTDIELLLSFFVVNQKIFIQDRDDSSKNQVWLISGTPTVTGANTSTAYYTFPVTLVSSAGGAFTNNHSILFGQISVATNAVTSATTSDGTCALSVASLGSLGLVEGATGFQFGDVETAAGMLAFNFDNTRLSWESELPTQRSYGFNVLNLAQDVFLYIPNATGTLALTSSTTGVPDKLTDGTIAGTLTLNSTSYTYGTGAAAAHRTALGLTTLATTTPAVNVATFLESPTSANLAAAVTGETGSGALVFGTSPTIDAPTISGSAAFTSTTRPTSAGTGMPSATSLMTRDDVALEPFYNLGSVFRVSATPAFANSGTGSAASQAAGDRWAALSSGTSNSGWGRAQIGRGITTIPSLSGAGINFASKLGVSIVLWLGNSAATNNLNIFRLRFGSDNTPVADGVDAVSYRGFGVEIKARGTSHDWRVYGHNGTSITYSAWSNTGLNANSLQSRISLTVMSNGAGSITASIGINGSRILSTISTTGGPTTAGTSAQSQVECHVANSASGTLPLAAALYDAIFYAQS
jgi:hypothetical protein